MRRTALLLLCPLFGSPALAEAPPSSADAPLIPREVLFGNPARQSPRISPDGQHLAWIAPLDGVLNVWVAPSDAPDQARPLTRDTGRGVRSFSWAWTSTHVLFAQDQAGDENWHVYSARLADGFVLDLTPFEGVSARLQATSPRHPDRVLVAMNLDNEAQHDLWRVHVNSGGLERVAAGRGHVDWVADADLQPRFAVRFTGDGGAEVLQQRGRAWRHFQTIPAEDSLTTQPLGLDAAGTTLYTLDSTGRDTAALLAVDLHTGARVVLAEDPRADVQGVLLHPTLGTVQAVAVDHERKSWQVLDPAIAPDFARLEALGGALDVVSRTLDDRTWIVAVTEDDRPVRWVRYDRPSGAITPLFSSRPDLEGQPLVPMHTPIIPARDGLDLVSMLSLPPGSDADGDGRPEHPVPMVLVVHGGPWARDSWGLSPEHQWLANRGYAVLSVNFRGSAGFGKAFLNAGNLEWGAAMQDDLNDAVDWAIQNGIATQDQVAILGGSYGGYATLVGLSATPERFACGVDIVGPSSLLTLLDSVPAYWEPMMDIFTTRVGDPRTPEGEALLRERSPLYRADQIQRPLLIAQGANDPRVRQAESDQIVAALQAAGVPVTYTLFPDEGHGFARPENRLAFYAVTEAFLAEHLGGRAEPMSAALLAASSMTVPVGAGQVQGLAEAMGPRQPAAPEPSSRGRRAAP